MHGHRHLLNSTGLCLDRKRRSGRPSVAINGHCRPKQNSWRSLTSVAVQRQSTRGGRFGNAGRMSQGQAKKRVVGQMPSVKDLRKRGLPALSLLPAGASYMRPARLRHSSTTTFSGLTFMGRIAESALKLNCKRRTRPPTAWMVRLTSSQDFADR